MMRSSSPSESLPFEGLVIVVPALNEQATIGGVVRSLLHVARVVLVVDDGSSDRTAEVAEAAGAQVVVNPGIHGYDPAIAFGINRAFAMGASACVTCDADGQHSPEDVRKVAQAVVLDGYDLSSGVRDRYNRWVEFLVGLGARFLLGSPDPFCGLKCYGRRFYDRVGGGFPDALNIGSAPLAWARNYQAKLCCLPIRVGERQDASRFGDSIKASLKLVRNFIATAALIGFQRRETSRKAE